MCLDAPGKEKIVGVEKDDIWPFRRGQSFQRRRGLTAVFGTADNLHTRMRASIACNTVPLSSLEALSTTIHSTFG